MPLIWNFAAAACAGLVLAALSTSGTALAAFDPGVAACQPAAGQQTAAVAQTGQLGTVVSGLAPINQLNQQSLFHCQPPRS
jgi:hypothetical protein